MKTVKIFSLFIASVLLSVPAFAWNKPTHKTLTMEALRYMGSSYATAEQKRAYNVYVNSAGGFTQAQNILGDAAKKVDEFNDTRMGGWWVGYHYTASDLTLGLADNNYTSWWHFITMTRGSDSHGNDHGGYDYRYHTSDPSVIDYDVIVKTWLYNQELHSSDYNATEAHYRQGTYSSWGGQYGDFQTIPWQPVDNLGKYWYDQFKSYPTLQSIGYVCHAAGDVGVAQHTWDTIANKHPEYENWVQDNFVSANLGDFASVQRELAALNATDDVRATLTKTAREAYLRPDPLYNSSYDARLRVARKMVPMSIATIVTVLTKGINHLYGQGGL